MITKETKIEELIPDGYELTGGCSERYSAEHEGIVVYIKKKKVKDFDWYAVQYSNKSCVFHTRKEIDSFLYYIGVCDYLNISFEIKIGLLKFICDDLKVSWKEVIHDRFVFGENNTYNNFYAICPINFIVSIFK